MTQRSSIFADPGNQKKIDVSDFSPKSAARPLPKPDEIDAASRDSRFVSREPESPPEVNQRYTRRKPMLYRTGRNVTFSVKTTQATVDLFYSLAESNGWKAGETFEKAIEALQRAIAAS